MPNTGDTQPPNDHRERDAWLAELWRPCRELSLGERAAKREEDRRLQKITEEWEIANPQDVAPTPQAVA